MEHLQGHIHHARPEYMPLFLIRYQSRRMYKKQIEPTILRRWTMSAKECLAEAACATAVSTANILKAQDTNAR